MERSPDPSSGPSGHLLPQGEKEGTTSYRPITTSQSGRLISALRKITK